MKKIPDVIKVGPRIYKIKMCNNTEIGIPSLVGEVDPQKQIIKILNDMAPVSKWEALLHEILHAISYDRAIDLSEQSVVSLSNGIFQVLIDNNLLKINGKLSKTKTRKIGFINGQDKKDTKDVPKKV